MALEHHRTTFRLLRCEPVVSKRAVRGLDALERALGVRLPASLREWYALEGAVARLFLEGYPMGFEPLGIAENAKRLKRAAPGPQHHWLIADYSSGVCYAAPFPGDADPLVSCWETDGSILDNANEWCERATAAVEFFDQHIPRSAAQITEAEVVNRLFPATGNANLTPTSIFDRQKSVAVDPEAVVRKVAERVADVEGPDEKLRVASEHLEGEVRRPLPEIERLLIHFYEDGIQGFAMVLKMRQIVALQHWLGNTEYTVADVIRSVQTQM